MRSCPDTDIDPKFHLNHNRIILVLGVKLVKLQVLSEFGHTTFYNNQIKARALIGQSALVYCAS